MAKKRVSEESKKKSKDAQEGADAIANFFGGMLGKARDALRSKRDKQPEEVRPEALEEEREQNYNKVMKKYKSRAR